MKATDTENQSTYWAEQDKRRRPDHPVIEAFARPKVEYIARSVLSHNPHAAQQRWRMLDVGCGNGYFSHYLQKYGPLVGIDFSVTMLRQHPGEALACASALQLPFGHDTFDLVVCSNLLHHVDDPHEAVREMTRVSRGYVALSEPNCHHLAMLLFHGIHPAERGALKFNRTYLRQLLAEAGLDEVAASAQGSVLPNKCPLPLLPFLRALNHVPLFRLYCVGVGAVRA